MYQNEIRNSMRKSARVTRKTVYGEKYDYGEKVKEKRNYILYVSGTGREKREIEEIEIPPPQTKILEEKELIDNYKYHESKNIKNQNQNRLSFTRHQRLSSPFEKTTYHEVTEDGKEIKSYNNLTKNNVNKNKNVILKTVKSESYKKNIMPMKKYVIENNEKKYNNYQNIQNIQNRKYENKYDFPEVETETKQDGEYIVKITTTRKPVNLNDGYEFDNIKKSMRQLRNINNSGNNFTFTETKNVKEKLNKPFIYRNNKNERNFVNSSSYDRNRNVYNSRYVKKEVKNVSSYNNYNSGKNDKGKYKSMQEVNCPKHASRTVRKEYVYQS